MKKSIQKLSLNKKAVSNLTATIKGGLRKPDDSFPTTDPTAQTFCYWCPPPDPY